MVSAMMTAAKGKQRIGIDARSLRAGPAGIATYVRNLLERIPELRPIDSRRPANNLAWNHTRALWAELRHRWRLYHAPCYTAPLAGFCPVVLTAADISYLTHPEWYPYRNDGLRRWYYRASLRRADRILVPSDFTAGEIVRLFPKLAGKIRRTYLGVSPSFRPSPDLAAHVRTAYGLPDHFVLHVGDIHSRRNLGPLATACRALGMPLILVGKVLRGGERFAGHVGLLSAVPMEDLVGIYNAATLLAYPSSYEGFGFPLVEAMACGLPVVASDLSCIPEICGDAAVLVSPSEEALVEGIRQALTRMDELRALGLARSALFTWEVTARETRKVYAEVMESQRG